MSRLQQRRSSLPVLPSGSLLGVQIKPEPPRSRSKLARLFSRHKGNHHHHHSNGFGLSSLESLPDCIPEDDIYENYASGTPPIFHPLRPRASTMSPLNISTESLGSVTSGEVDMSPRPSIVDLNPLPVSNSAKHRQRRGSLPVVGLSLSPNHQMRGANGGMDVRKSRSMDKLFSKRSHKKTKLFTVTVNLPSGFVQEVGL